MADHLTQLAADPSFRRYADALGTRAAKCQATPLDPMFEHLRRFTPLRRREAQLALLAKANRSVVGKWHADRANVPAAILELATAIRLLAEHAAALRPLLDPALDDIVSLAGDAGHPLHQLIEETAVSLGFSNEEVGWMFDELRGVEYRPVRLLVAGGFEDFAAMLSALSAGENGLLLAGFVRFTGDAEVDERLTQLVIRLRQRGVTPSLFLALTIVLVAHAVATFRPSARQQKARSSP